MLIYCAHRFGGESYNKSFAEMKILELQKTDRANTYISPIHAFGFMYESLSYDEGMELCLSLLKRCDKLLVLSEESEGVRREIEFAEQNGIPIEKIEENNPGTENKCEGCQYLGEHKEFGYKPFKICLREQTLLGAIHAYWDTECKYNLMESKMGGISGEIH